MTLFVKKLMQLIQVLNLINFIPPYFLANSRNDQERPRLRRICKIILLRRSIRNGPLTRY
jgi:hypothetical protein